MPSWFALVANPAQDWTGEIGFPPAFKYSKVICKPFYACLVQSEMQFSSQVSVYQSRLKLLIAGIVLFGVIARVAKMGKPSGSVD